MCEQSVPSSSGVIIWQTFFTSWYLGNRPGRSLVPCFFDADLTSQVSSGVRIQIATRSGLAKPRQPCLLMRRAPRRQGLEVIWVWQLSLQVTFPMRQEDEHQVCPPCSQQLELYPRAAGTRESQVLTFFKHTNFERVAAAETTFIHLEPKFSYFDPMSRVSAWWL